MKHVSSQKFRTTHKIIGSVPILRQKVVDRGRTLFETHDFLDLNGDGDLNFHARYGFDGQEKFTYEPAIVSPSYADIKGYGEKSHRQIVTQDELRQGVFIEELGDKSKSGGHRPINTFVNTIPVDFGEQDLSFLRKLPVYWETCENGAASIGRRALCGGFPPSASTFSRPLLLSAIRRLDRWFHHTGDRALESDHDLFCHDLDRARYRLRNPSLVPI